MTPDFHLFDVLTRHGVPFVVVGGHAVNFHGFIRGTEDTDVLWVRSPAAGETCRAAGTARAPFTGKHRSDSLLGRVVLGRSVHANRIVASLTA